MIRSLAILFCILATNVHLAANEGLPQSNRVWTHQNGVSAQLELIRCDKGLVAFKKPDGKKWVMPLSDLSDSDQQIALQLKMVVVEGSRGMFTSMKKQESDLENIQTIFDDMQFSNPELYGRLSDLAEYPLTDYEIDVNESGTYFLQMFLKEGLSVDDSIESELQLYMNSNSTDPVSFKLTQISQNNSDIEEALDIIESQGSNLDEVTVLENPTPPLPVETTDPLISDALSKPEWMGTLDQGSSFAPIQSTVVDYPVMPAVDWSVDPTFYPTKIDCCQTTWSSTCCTVTICEQWISDCAEICGSDTTCRPKRGRFFDFLFRNRFCR